VSKSMAKRLASVLVVLACATLPCLAQQTNVGGITGTVRDASGAVIPGADVVAVDQATQVGRNGVSNQSGIYTIQNLPIGTYSVSVTKEGFRKSVQTNIPVLSGETFTVDVTLAIGAVSQTVTVTSEAPLLDTTSVNQGTTRNSLEIAQLPIPLQGEASRGAVAVVESLAGVNYDTGGGNQVWTVISRATINGVMPGTQGYQIDGIDAGMGEGESAEDFGHPNPDMVEEVRLVTNTDTTMGFNGGVSIAMTTKSGTNQVHGDAYYYNRNAALEARNFFLPSVGVDNQNEGGVSVGGPIYIPHVYDGRNRTFFFANFMTFRFANNGPLAFAGGLSLGSVPTALMRQGNFSQLLGASVGNDALGRPIYAGEVYDPSTTRTVNGTTVRDPFSFGGQLNVINPAQLSSISKAFVGGYQMPTLPGTSLNWLGFPYTSYLGDQRLFLRFDHTISSKQRISFSLQKPDLWWFPLGKGPGGFGRGHFDLWEGAGYLQPSVANGFFTNNGEDRYILNYTWSVSSNKLFSFRAGMNRVPHRTIEPYPNAQLLNGAASAGLKGTLTTKTPNVAIQGFSNFGPQYNLDNWNPQKNSVTADLSWMKGNHDLRFGSEYIGEFDAYYGGDGGQGNFNFKNVETGLPGYTSTGEGIASYMLGQADSASVVSPTTSRSATGGIAFFVQDNWRVTHKLTINAGLRWDLFIPLHLLHNKISTFNPTLANPGAGGLLGALSLYGTAPGENGLVDVANYYYKAFDPKFGFAYQLNPKTVFRASAGISYLPYYQKFAGDLKAKVPQDGWSATRTAASLDNGVTPAFQWDATGFPLTFPTFPTLDPTLDNNGPIGYLDRHDNRPEMVENFGAEVAREFPGHLTLRVGYVGTFAHRLESNYNMNVLPLSDFALGSTLLTSNINSAAAKAAGIKVPYPGFNSSVAQALLPYPQYQAVTDTLSQWGNSNYNALQINVQRQFGNFVFLGNLTISKSLCNVDFGGATSAPSNILQYPTQRNNIRSLCGPPSESSSGDKPKVLNLSYVWNIPAGRGKRWLTGAKGPLNQIVSGWTVSAYQTYNAGGTLRVSSSSDSIPGVGTAWPVLVPGTAVKAIASCGGVNPGDPNSRRLNIGAFRDAFTAGGAYALGNVAVLPNVRRCGYLDEDLGIQKAFPFTEHARAILGANAQNIFNRHYLSNLSTDIDVPSSFGRYSGTSFGRSLQLFFRIEF